MPFDIKQLVTKRWGENYELHDQYINPQFVKVLRTIGFDKIYRRAEGQYLYDAEGERYLDFLSGYGVFALGRNHPRIKQTIKDLLDLDLSNLVQMDCALPAGLLAEKLISLVQKQVDEGIDTVFFTNSGTEAVEGAIKFARGATKRERILFLDHAFHGLTLGHRVGRLITVDGHEQRGHQAEDRRHHHAAFGHLLMALLQQKQGGNPQHEQRCHDKAGAGSMDELADRHRREDHLPDVLHLKAGFIRVEGHTDRVLHPAVGNQNPQGRKVGAHRHHPGGEEVELLPDPLPAEEHHERADLSRLAHPLVAGGSERPGQRLCVRVRLRRHSVTH